MSTEPPQRPTIEPPPAPPSAAVLPPPRTTEAWSPAADLVLFHRRTIYLQGALFLVAVALAFGFGYLVGRSGAAAKPSASGNRTPDEQEQVLLEGQVVYDAGSGRPEGDAGAVVVVLPESRMPGSRLPLGVLPPGAPGSAEADVAVRTIEGCGGAYGRADASGAFALVLPRPGKYRLLLVSRHASRPADDPIDELDREEMGRYFRRPEQWIGPWKYRWTLEEVRPGGPAVAHHFGRNEQH